MSRDKYSDDHIITVKKGEGKLKVEGDFEISKGLEVGSVKLRTPITQTYRVPGISFRPSSAIGISNVSYSKYGRVEFSSIETTLIASVNIPHGATLTSVTIKGAADTADDSLNVLLYRSAGVGAFTVLNETYTNTGTQFKDTVGVNVPVDYTDETMFILNITGTKVSDTYLIYVDLNYVIEEFPIDSAASL